MSLAAPATDCWYSPRRRRASGVGVGQQLVEQVHQPLDHPGEAFGAEGQHRRVAPLLARLGQRLVRCRLGPGGQSGDSLRRQRAHVPALHAERLQELKLVHLVVHDPRRGLHRELAQPCGPGHAHLDIHLQEGVEAESAVTGKLGSESAGDLFASRLAGHADQRLLYHRQPGTGQTKLVEALARQVEQHDRAVLHQRLSRQPLPYRLQFAGRGRTEAQMALHLVDVIGAGLGPFAIGGEGVRVDSELAGQEVHPARRRRGHIVRAEPEHAQPAQLQRPSQAVPVAAPAPGLGQIGGTQREESVQCRRVQLRRKRRQVLPLRLREEPDRHVDALRQG